MAETISRKSIVYDILFDTSKAKRGANEAGKAINDIGKSTGGLDAGFKSLGKTMLAAFATERVLAFAKEASELADKAKGVKAAFEQLNNVSLQKLREATNGTVSDLTLMQAAVRADKFKIPMEQLAGFFKFAAIRARETGQSVQFLTDSIIDGIGRKSPLILDNLGLSAERIGTEFKKTGDFASAVGNIIDKELSKSVEGAASASEQLATSVENFQLALGTLINDGFLDDFKGFLSAVIQLTTDLITGQTSYNEELEKTGSIIKKYTEDDVKNLIVSSRTLIEIRKQEAEQGRKLSEVEIAAIRAIYEAQAQAIIDTTKTVADAVDGNAEAAANSLETLGKELAEVQKQIKVADPDKLLFAQLTYQATILELKIDSILSKFKQVSLTIKDADENIKKLGASTNELKPAGVIDPGVWQEGINILKQTKSEYATLAEVLKDNAGQISGDFASIFGNLSEMAAEGSKAQLAFAFANILAANAEALAVSIKEAMKLPYPANIPAAISSVATVVAMFTQVSALVSKAKAAQANASNVSVFAEGEVDIHRPGEVKGKDSIPALLMPGETVLRTKTTQKYKPLIEAMHNDTLLSDIASIDIAPALKSLQKNEERERGLNFDEITNRLYRQYLATSEGTTVQKRVANILEVIADNTRSTKKRFH